jgi:hypothetical protein
LNKVKHSKNTQKDLLTKDLPKNEKQLALEAAGTRAHDGALGVQPFAKANCKIVISKRIKCRWRAIVSVAIQRYQLGKLLERYGTRRGALPSDFNVWIQDIAHNKQASASFNYY